MPIFFEDEAFKYEATRWRKRHLVTAKKDGTTLAASNEQLEKLWQVFSSFDIVKEIDREQRDHMTIWAYRYFCLAVVGPMSAAEYWDATPGQEVVMALLSEWFSHSGKM